MITTYLEMNSPDEVRPCRRACEAMEFRRAEAPNGALNRFLYTEVGRNWSWTDRLVWSSEEWQAYAESPEVQTWVGSVRGTPAGYFELRRSCGKGLDSASRKDAKTRSDGDSDPREGAEARIEVEIAYFGLMPMFIGRGLGGRLLEAAILCAWDFGAERVWVHTCTLDGPHALANYMARGMKVYRVEVETG